MKRFFYVSVLTILSFGMLRCTKKQSETSPQNTQKQNTSGKKWLKLSETLDFYDEAFIVKADFKLEIFVNSEKQSETSGKYEYNRGESKWFYFSDGKLQKTIECYVDKAYVKLPQKKKKHRRRHRRGRRRSKKNNLPPGVVAVHEARYPCALQALVHYNAALNKNRLMHDNKVFIVNDYNPDKKIIKKFTIVKNASTTLVYTFENIKFYDQSGVEIHPDAKPEVPPATDKKQPAATANTGNKTEKPDAKVNKPDAKPNKPAKPSTAPADEEEPPL